MILPVALVTVPFERKYMKPHKHAEIIKAWADGASIQVKTRGMWLTCGSPNWMEDKEYRIKAEPKPDISRTMIVEYSKTMDRFFIRKDEHWEIPNMHFIIDGETGDIKSARVIK
jgi:hypothetical protein